MRSQCKLRSGSSARRHAGRQLQSGGGVTQRSPDKTSLSAGTGPSILAAQGMRRLRKLAAVALTAAKARPARRVGCRWSGARRTQPRRVKCTDPRGIDSELHPAPQRQAIFTKELDAPLARPLHLDVEVVE